MSGLTYPADTSARWPGSQATPASGSETPYVGNYGPIVSDTPLGYTYTEGLRWDPASNWPASRATPSRSQEGQYGATSEERIRGVAQEMMARVPQSRPSSSSAAGPGYIRGPFHWPPTPPTPLPSDTVTVDPERRTVVVRHGAPQPPAGYTSGLAWTGPTQWPGSSRATPAPPSRETLVRTGPRPGSSVSAPAEHSSSETLVQGQEDGSPRGEVNLPWNFQVGTRYQPPSCNKMYRNALSSSGDGMFAGSDTHGPWPQLCFYISFPSIRFP